MTRSLKYSSTPSKPKTFIKKNLRFSQLPKALQKVLKDWVSGKPKEK